MPITPYDKNVGSEEWDSLVVISATTMHVFAELPVDVSGELALKWNVKEFPKMDGARQVYQGYVPANVTVTLKLWNDYLVSKWEEMVNDVQPKPGVSGPSPIELVHPKLTLHKLRKFWILKIPILKTLSPGIFEGSIECMQWFAQPKESVKPADGSSIANRDYVQAPQPGAPGSPVFGPPSSLAPPKPSEAEVFQP